MGSKPFIFSSKSASRFGNSRRALSGLISYQGCLTSGNHTPYLSEKIAQRTFLNLHLSMNARTRCEVYRRSGDTAWPESRKESSFWAEQNVKYTRLSSICTPFRRSPHGLIEDNCSLAFTPAFGKQH